MCATLDLGRNFVCSITILFLSKPVRFDAFKTLTILFLNKNKGWCLPHYIKVSVITLGILHSHRYILRFEGFVRNV